MAEHANITRRAAIVGALVSSAALTAPSVQAVGFGEEANAKVRRLQRELSDALAELMRAP